MFLFTTTQVAIAAALILPACGDDTTGTSGTSSTSSTSSTTGSTSSTTGSTDGDLCTDVHEGDLYITEDTDLESLAYLGHVTGYLHITMDEFDQTDLSFLSCLHTVDKGLQVIDNAHLTSTEGLTNLHSLGELQISGNPKLQVITGFTQIDDLFALRISNNPMLNEIHLDTLTSVSIMEIGRCLASEATGHHFGLVDLAGFSGITTIDWLDLSGNEALLSADPLFDALAANGAAKPLGNAQLDTLKVENRVVCGNEGGDPKCYCPDGD